MLVMRFFAFLFLLIATVALVSDVTPALNGSGHLAATSLGKHWQDLAPGALAGAKSAVRGSTAPWVWDVVFATLTALPTFILFGGLAVAAGWFGRRRYAISIYAN